MLKYKINLYDDSGNAPGIPENEAERILREKEHSEATEMGATPDIQPRSKTNKNDNKATKPAQKSAIVEDDPSGNSLGVMRQHSTVHSAVDKMWKNVPLQNMPTKGLFYPDNIEITIKSAQVMEIRHWSAMDENDYLDINAKMNFVVEKCVRITQKKDGALAPMDWRILKDIDRMYLLFLIQELTFPNNENKLIMRFSCENPNCPGDDTFKTKEIVKSNMLNIFSLPEELMKHYSPEHKKIRIVSEKNDKAYMFTLPSIGVSQKLKAYVKHKQGEGEKIDKAFLRVAPYIIHEYTGLTNEAIEQEWRNSTSWNTNEVLLLGWVADQMESGVSLTARMPCKRCNETMELPLFFRGGIQIKSFFTVSDPTAGII